MDVWFPKIWEQAALTSHIPVMHLKLCGLATARKITCGCPLVMVVHDDWFMTGHSNGTAIPSHHRLPGKPRVHMPVEDDYNSISCTRTWWLKKEKKHQEIWHSTNGWCISFKIRWYLGAAFGVPFEYPSGSVAQWRRPSWDTSDIARGFYDVDGILDGMFRVIF